MDDERIDIVVGMLEADAFRRQGSVEYDAVLRLAEKRDLDSASVASVVERLRAIDVEIVGVPEVDSTTGREPKRTDEIDEPIATGIDEPTKELADAFGIYLRAAGQIELLDREHEVALMRRIRRGEEAATQLRQAQGRMDPSLAAFVRDGEEARHDFIEANLRLVVALAKGMTQTGDLALEDLVQEGNFGLMRSVNKWDHTRGLRFSTYASWWIWQALYRAVADRGRAVRIPVHLYERAAKARRLSSLLAREKNGTPPSVYELAEHLSWSPEFVQFLLDIWIRPRSLDDPDDDRPVTDDSHSAARATWMDPEGRVVDRDLIAHIRAAIDLLKPKQRYVMRLRFGLDDGEAHTLEQIGERLGVTREYVRQIEARALERLRHRSQPMIRELVPLPPQTPAEENDAASSPGSETDSAGTASGDTLEVDDG